MVQQHTPVSTSVAGKNGASPAAGRRNPALRANMIRARFTEQGRRDKHQIERVVQSMRVDPNNALISFMQLGKIPRNQLDNFMILAAESVMLPENRPRDLPEGAIDIWDESLIARLTYARPLMEWSVDGGMVDKMSNAIVGFVQMLMRPFRRRQMREMNNAEQSDGDGEYE